MCSLQELLVNYKDSKDLSTSTVSNRKRSSLWTPGVNKLFGFRICWKLVVFLYEILWTLEDPFETLSSLRTFPLSCDFSILLCSFQEFLRNSMIFFSYWRRSTWTSFLWTSGVFCDVFVKSTKSLEFLVSWTSQLLHCFLWTSWVSTNPTTFYFHTEKSRTKIIKF